jgi:hypothetical protein
LAASAMDESVLRLGSGLKRTRQGRTGKSQVQLKCLQLVCTGSGRYKDKQLVVSWREKRSKLWVRMAPCHHAHLARVGPALLREGPAAREELVQLPSQSELLLPLRPPLLAVLARLPLPLLAVRLLA